MNRRLAPAKINLALHVTGQQANGFHVLDSLVCFANFGDVVTIEPAPLMRFDVTGPMRASVPDGPENLILKAAGMFETDQGAHLRLEKNLPTASGIGGGSSDGAAALHLLAELWGEPLPDCARLLALGADVPVCVAGETARMQGVGDVLEPVLMPVLDAVLVNPGIAVSTPQVFEKLLKKENPPMHDLPGSRDVDVWLSFLAAQRNDLEDAAQSLVPDVAHVLKVLLAQETCNLARMSGSGATCFGLFPTREDAAKVANKIARDHPDWWVKAVRLG